MLSCKLKHNSAVHIDPLTKSYPELTPYQFASNTPIWAIDLDGLEAWKTTRQWTKADVDAYATYVTTQIQKYDADDVEFQCADLAVSLLIGYAKDKGLPVKFTMVNGKVFTNESESFNGYKIKSGDVIEFERAANNSTNATSLLNDMSVAPKGEVNAGDMLNTGVHVEVVEYVEKVGENDRYKVDKAAGNNPAAEINYYSHFEDGKDILRWDVMKDVDSNPPTDKENNGKNAGGYKVDASPD